MLVDLEKEDLIYILYSSMSSRVLDLTDVPLHIKLLWFFSQLHMLYVHLFFTRFQK